MYKLKVLMEDHEHVIAEDVVKIFYEGKTLKLVNILNETVNVENAMVSSIDIGKEELKIINTLYWSVF